MTGGRPCWNFIDQTDTISEAPQISNMFDRDGRLPSGVNHLIKISALHQLSTLIQVTTESINFAFSCEWIIPSRRGKNFSASEVKLMEQFSTSCFKNEKNEQFYIILRNYIYKSYWLWIWSLFLKFWRFFPILCGRACSVSKHAQEQDVDWISLGTPVLFLAKIAAVKKVWNQSEFGLPPMIVFIID